jgi:hypothetical protein
MVTTVYSDADKASTFFGESAGFVCPTHCAMSHKIDSVVFKQSSDDAATDEPPGVDPPGRFPSRASPRNSVYVNFFGPPTGRWALAEALREARRGWGISFSRTGPPATTTGNEKVGAATAPGRASACLGHRLRCASSVVRRRAPRCWAGDRTSSARDRGPGSREPDRHRSRPSKGPSAFRRALRVPRVRLDTPIPPDRALPPMHPPIDRGGRGSVR